MKRNLSAMIIVIILISVLGVASVEAANTHPYEDLNKTTVYQENTIESIQIIGNESFGDYEEYLSGNGTEEDPYILENYTIKDQSEQIGIFIQNTGKHFKVKECEIRDFERGVEIDRGSNFTLENNRIKNVDTGLRIGDSDGNLFRGNSFIENRRLGIELRGDSEHNRFYENELYNTSISLRNLARSTSQKIAENNTVNGHPIIYIKNSYDREISGEYGQVIIENSLEINLDSIKLKEGSIGIEILDSSKISITNIVAKNHSLRGVYACRSENLTIEHSMIWGNQEGIFFEEVYNSSIYNNLMNNSVQARDDGENEWDAGDPEEGGEGGNYWSDYEGEDRGDGIGEEPYEIEGGGNEDGYPLTAPIAPPADIKARPVSTEYVNISWDEPFYSLRHPLENVTLYRGTDEENISEYERVGATDRFFLDENISEEYLFSLNRTEYEEYLEEGTIPAELVEVFEEKGYDIEDDAMLVEEDEKWLLSGTETKYVIELEDEKINISREGKEYYYRLRASSQKYKSVMSGINTAVPESTRPTVEDYHPKGEEVPVNSTVTVEFSEEMRKDSINISFGGIEGNITGEGSTFHFIPEGNLTYAESYSVEVKGTDLARNRLEKGVFSWEFSTISNGTITGRVLEENGEPVVEAIIELERDSRSFTNEDGEFEIEANHGNLTIEISKEGYETKKIYLEVEAGEVKNIGDITLEKQEGIFSRTFWPMAIVGALVLLLGFLAIVVTFKNWEETQPPEEDEDIYEESFDDITQEEFDSWWEDEGS